MNSWPVVDLVLASRSSQGADSGVAAPDGPARPCPEPGPASDHPTLIGVGRYATHRSRRVLLETAAQGDAPLWCNGGAGRESTIDSVEKKVISNLC